MIEYLKIKQLQNTNNNLQSIDLPKYFFLIFQNNLMMMLRILSKIILCLLVTINSRSFAQEIFNAQLLEKIINREQQSAEPKISFRESAVTDDYNLNYLNAYWELDPAVYYIKGSLTYYFQPAENGLASISFDLSDSLQFSYFIYH